MCYMTICLLHQKLVRLNPFIHSFIHSHAPTRICVNLKVQIFKLQRRLDMNLMRMSLKKPNVLQRFLNSLNDSLYESHITYDV
jgi:hypothetical protein